MEIWIVINGISYGFKSFEELPELLESQADEVRETRSCNGISLNI